MIKYTSKQEMTKILKQITNADCVVEIDFTNVDDLQMYFHQIYKTIPIPPEEKETILTVQYIDVMRDPCYLDGEKMFFILRNFDKFVQKNYGQAMRIIEIFNEYIIPFWTREIVKCMVNEKIRDYRVYYTKS